MEAATTVAAFAEVISTEAVCAVVAVARAEEAVVAARAEEAVVAVAPVVVVAVPAAAAVGIAKFNSSLVAANLRKPFGRRVFPYCLAKLIFRTERHL
jgi:BarA-like signal transduction histidine kinase